MIFGAMAFVSCGDDDDDNKSNGGNGGGNGGEVSVVITPQELIGTWYGVNESSQDAISTFVMHFMDSGAGHYVEYSASAAHNWEMEEGHYMDMSWTLVNNVLKAKLTKGEKYEWIMGEVIKKYSDNKVRVKRFSDENGTVYDEVDLNRVGSAQEFEAIINRMIEEKRNK